MSILRLFLDNNNGTALVITLIMATILTIIGATFTSMVIFQIRNAPWQIQRLQEFYIAEAGLDKGIALLKDDDDWSADGCGDGSATHHFPGEGIWYPLYDPGAGSDVSDFTLDNGTYSVQLLNPPGSDGKAIEIRSEGGIGDSRRIIQIRTQLLDWTIFGDEGVKILGHPMIDSYNSDEGLYEEQIPGENGNIRSNEDIVLKGNCTIAGNVTPGPDGSIWIIGGSVSITGSTERASERVSLPPVDMTFFDDDEIDGAEDLDDDEIDGAEDPRKSGHKTYTLTDGIYYFTDIDFKGQSELITNGDVIIYCESASFVGQAKITVNGTLKIYCTGDFTGTGGGIINTNKKPGDFILYSTGGYIKLTGGSDFYGAVYAPNAYVDIGGNHDYYGAIIGREVDAHGNAEIHCDEALGIGSTMTTASWHEVY